MYQLPNLHNVPKKTFTLSPPIFYHIQLSCELKSKIIYIHVYMRFLVNWYKKYDFLKYAMFLPRLLQFCSRLKNLPR